MIMGLWPGVDAGPVEPGETRIPLTWVPVGPEGGAVWATYAYPGDTVIAVAWPNIWMSPNGGGSWTEVAHYAFFGGQDMTGTADGSILLAREGGLLIRSTDWCASWDTVMQAAIFGDIILSYDKLSTVYVAPLDTVNGLIRIHRSTNNGANWAWRGDIPAKPQLYTIAAAPSNPSYVYFAYGSDDSTLVSVSTDGGTSWTRVLSYGNTYPRVTAIAVNPLVPQNAFMAMTVNSFPATGVLKVTTDGGTSWATADSGKLYNHLRFYQDTFLLAGSGIPEGLKRFKINPPQDSTWLYNQEAIMFIDHLANANLYVGTCGVGLIRSSNGGTSWDERNTGLYGIWAPTPHNISARGNTAYILDYISGRLYKSTDGGATWVRNALNPVFDVGQGGFGFAGSCVHAATANLVYVGDASLGNFSVFYRTTDGGTSWTPVSLLTAPVTYCMADAAGDTIYGFGISLMSMTTGVFKSIDRGATWNLVRNYPLGYYMLYPPNDVKVSAWGDVFMTDSMGVSVSTNGGGSWSQMSPNLQQAWWMDTTASTVLFSSSDTNLQGVWSWNDASWSWLFYGGDGYDRLLVTPDVAGEDGNRLITCWPGFSLGGEAYVVSRPEPDSSWDYDTIIGYLPASVTLTGNAAILGTLGGPFLRAPFVGTSAAEQPAGPAVFRAFIAGNRLVLQLPATGQVDVRAYDVAGRLQSTIFSGKMESGLNSLDLPALGAGVYLVRVSTGSGDTRVVKWANTGN